jgi:formate dehydrogenase major subunit
MHQGKINGYLAQGFNVLAAAPNKAKMTASLSKLKFLVIMDPLATATSEIWRNYREHNDVDPSQIQTEVFRLPTTCFAEEDGALVNSARWLQWHWKGATPPARRAATSKSCPVFSRGSARCMPRRAVPSPIQPGIVR